MSVIVGRALPLVEDGLKPVHRRVLYSMGENGFRPDRSYVKCARVVGEVMGNYHPHGDSSIYDALVRLAQPWSMRYPLIDGQGNFGSRGNDPRRRHALHRVPAVPAGDGDAAGHRRGHRRLLRQLRRQDPGAGRPAVPGAEPADQRQRRDRGRDGHQRAAAQPARGRRRRGVGAGQLGGDRRGAARRPDGADQGPGLPDRRPDRRPGRHRAGLPHRPRLGADARGGRGRGGRPRPHHPGRHRAALPGQPGQPDRVDRQPAPRRQAGRHRRDQRRVVGPRRHAHRDHAQARRGGQGGAEQPLQAHPAAVRLRRQHAGHRRRRAAHAAAGPGGAQLHPAPDRGHRPAHPLPAAQGRGAGPHPARLRQGARRAGRGHRADPAPRRRSTSPASA